jgi:hydroxymethylpyrimidine pyrophosphatase-like HAD family hydrolase
MASKRDVPSGIRLVVADVDGTLVTPDKILTPRARAVVQTIIEAGSAFTITSGRPPLGLTALIADLQLQDPITAFNGGLVVRPDLSVIREHLVPSEAAQAVIDILTKGTLDVWCTATRIGTSRRATRLTWIAKSGRSSFPRPWCLHTRVYWIESSRSSV